MTLVACGWGEPRASQDRATVSRMPEPLRSRLRQTHMTRLLSRSTVALGAVLVLAGCGSAPATSSGAHEPAKVESAAKVGSCPVDSPAVTAAKTVATVDLDGDGRREAVRKTASTGDCPDVIFSKQGDGYVSAQLPTDQPPLDKAYGVQVPGRAGALLVTRQDHPRGGFQLRVFAQGENGLAELEVDGHSLVPFVALDVQEHPLSIDCADGGVVVTEAVAHEPHGVVFAWDIKQTSYAVNGSNVTAGVTKEIADNVLPAQLDSKWPDLVDYAAFKSCRTS